MTNQIEILAPAGSYESLVAGVNSGANAVYFGCGELNARRGAQNLDADSLPLAARYCKARAVKMYLALNTIVYDREREEVLKTIALACQNGIDAIIVQDLGVAKLVRHSAPEMPLHASTQMSIHNVSGAKALLELGFTRAVLAREMSREEIAKVTEEVPIETEVFVHGALCMSVSGQCYMSAIIGERSGNRGLCAQPCRLPFSTGRGDEGYALSLKDLSLAQRVEELAKLGVTSFKIEGRMKRPEYVAAAVKSFCDARKGLAPDLATLEAAFSRSGFTQGYFDGRTGLDMFGIREKEDVMAGQKVFKSLADQASKEYPHIGVDFSFVMQAGAPVELIGSDGLGHTASAQGQVPELAQNRPTDEELVRRSLEKTGGTCFFLRELSLSLDEGLVCPVSQINKLRREVLEELLRLREEVIPVTFHPTPISEQETKHDARIPSLWAQLRQLSQITPKLVNACQYILVPLGELVRQIDNLPTAYRDKLVISLPRVIFGDDQKALTPRLEELYRLGVTHLSTGNLGGIFLGKRLGFTVHGELGLNLSNSDAAAEYARLGLNDALLSVELSLPRAQTIARALPLGFFAYGKLPLMLTRNCPIKLSGCKDCQQYGVLTDRKKETFEVRCTGTTGGAGRYSEVFNGKTVYLADRWNEFTGFDYGLLFFTGEMREDVDQVIDDYTQTYAPRENIMRGMYYRNVK